MNAPETQFTRNVELIPTLLPLSGFIVEFADDINQIICIISYQEMCCIPVRFLTRVGIVASYAKVLALRLFFLKTIRMPFFQYFSNVIVLRIFITVSKKPNLLLFISLMIMPMCLYTDLFKEGLSKLMMRLSLICFLNANLL